MNNIDNLPNFQIVETFGHIGNIEIISYLAINLLTSGNTESDQGVRLIISEDRVGIGTLKTRSELLIGVAFDSLIESIRKRTFFDADRVSGRERVGKVNETEVLNSADSALISRRVERGAYSFRVSGFVAELSDVHDAHPKSDEQKAEKHVRAMTVLDYSVTQILVRVLSFVFRVVLHVFVFLRRV